MAARCVGETPHLLAELLDWALDNAPILSHHLAVSHFLLANCFLPFIYLA